MKHVTHAASAGRDGGSRNRDAALPFLFHPVRDGCTVVNLTHFVHHAGVEKNPFGSGGFSRVNVGGDADISDAVQWKGAGHEGGLREVKKRRLYSTEWVCRSDREAI